jgi:putative ABC transport system permease protein
VRSWLARLGSLFGRRQLDDDLDDEVRFHLEMTARDYERRGWNPVAARLKAQQDFGGVAQMKEAYREQRGLPAIETFVQDARYAIRTLLRAPGFTAAVLLTLALGTGANTAIFSVVNTVLLRPLPYPESDRLVQLVRRHPSGVATGQTGVRYLFFRDHMRIGPIAAWRNPAGINLVNGDNAEFVRAMPVSKEFFDVYGVRPAIGASFTAEHDRVGGPRAAVISNGLWRRQFGGNPAVVGSSILLGETLHVVVGVMPASFVAIPPADLYVPLRPSTTGPGGGFNYGVTARVPAGATLEQVNAQAAATWEAMGREFPKVLRPTELPSGFEPLQATTASSVRPALLAILGAVGLLLVIACANSANLLLARASARGREIAVRAALGASRGRIIRQLLTESVVLSIVGAALGVALAYWAMPLLLSLTPPQFRAYQEVHLDSTVLLVSLSIAVGTGLLFGLAPAITVSRPDLVEAFKDDGTRSVGSARSAWLRQSLVVGEVALCMLLLVGAALLVQTFVRMRAVDPGFDPAHVVTARMSLQGERYAKREAYTRFFEEGLERLRRIPGVRAAAVVNGVPIERGLNLNIDILDIREANGKLRFEDISTDWRYASTDYFSTMGIRIVEGRGFEAGDGAGAAPVAVVNEAFARRFFKDTRALGQHLRVFDSDGAIEIVGIAKDVREAGLTGPILAVMYVPVLQANPSGVNAAHAYFQMSWVVRTDTAGPALEHQMREALRSLDSKQPFSSFRTMDEIKSAAVDDQRFQMTLLGVFSGIGLLLATAGVYGLVSYSATQRTREFGIRMALGAPRALILRTVIRSGLLLALIGVAVGIAASIASRKFLERFVWGISPVDPVTIGAVAVVLILVTVLASLMPALRAVRSNPVTALRD